MDKEESITNDSMLVVVFQIILISTKLFSYCQLLPYCTVYLLAQLYSSYKSCMRARLSYTTSEML